jgi:ribose/xylose/arabinose/galactoside ABC-type transport system permease subunit
MKATIILNNALFLALVIMSAYFATQSSTYLTDGNFTIIGINSSILAVIAVPSAMLVIAGYIDLSVGSIVGLCGLVSSMAVLDWNWSNAAGIALGVAVGAGVGVANGLMCATLGFSPIIVTLGMLGVIRGATLLISSTPTYGLGGVWNTIGSSSVIGVPVLCLIAIVAFAIGFTFLEFTPWGRYVYAIGVNPQASFLSGLSVKTIPFFLYIATGAASGVAGIMFTARLGGAAPADLGIGMELSVLTAVLLGGVAFAGGRGSLVGVFVAILFLGVLQDGLVLMNVQPFVEQLAQGLALVAAAGLDVAATALARRTTARRQVTPRLRLGKAAQREPSREGA